MRHEHRRVGHDLARAEAVEHPLHAVVGEAKDIHGAAANDQPMRRIRTLVEQQGPVAGTDQSRAFEQVVDEAARLRPGQRRDQRMAPQP